MIKKITSFAPVHITIVIKREENDFCRLGFKLLGKYQYNDLIIIAVVDQPCWV